MHQYCTRTSVLAQVFLGGNTLSPFRRLVKRGVMREAQHEHFVVGSLLDFKKPHLPETAG
jgi:hypothetical protein